MLSSLAASQRLCKQAGEGALDVLELCVRKYPDLQGTDEGPALGHLLQYLRGGGVGLIPKQVYKVRVEGFWGGRGLRRRGWRGGDGLDVIKGLTPPLVSSTCSHLLLPFSVQLTRTHTLTLTYICQMFMPSAKAQASFAMIKSHAVKPIQTVLPKDDPGEMGGYG